MLYRTTRLRGILPSFSVADRLFWLTWISQSDAMVQEARILTSKTYPCKTFLLNKRQARLTLLAAVSPSAGRTETLQCVVAGAGAGGASSAGPSGAAGVSRLLTEVTWKRGVKRLLVC